MWNKFSLKIQLILIMTFLVIIIETLTLFVVKSLYKHDRETLAIDRAQTLVQSLNNDLLKIIVSSNTDQVSNFSFRLSGFKHLNSLVVYDNKSKELYQYKNTKRILEYKNNLEINNIFFTEKNLYIKEKVIADNYTFGYVILNINLTEHINRQEKDLFIIFLIFPFALFLTFIISLLLSEKFTKPFSLLSKSIKSYHSKEENFTTLKTQSKNEIKDLFDGFNNMMHHIIISSKKLKYQANHDQLTGLYNRFYIEKELKQMLKCDENKNYAILNISIDNFKLINESFSYQAGDKLLKMLAHSYSQILPKEGIFARLDAEHFIVIISITKEEELHTLVNDSILHLSDYRFVWEENPSTVSSSIGVVCFESNEYTFNELMKISNASLYTAKTLAKNKAYYYEKNDDISKRFDMEINTSLFIKEALSNGASKFELFAQAIVPLQKKSEKVSYEILIRMWDKNGNFVPPDNFLPTANRYQLMCDIDIFVLWTYLETVHKNKKHLNNLHSVHINLDGASLNNPNFQKKVKEAVEYFDFPWEKLELEITETSAIGNFSQANEFIKWLKNVGIGLALDDFGTGMASFEYLKSLPFDIIKIDGSFIKDMHTDPTDKAVIKYIHEIASLKEQETVAEYVETQEDVDELTKIGITYGQGYFLGKPKALKEWL